MLKRYPWEKWLAKTKFTLTRHKQFDCQCHSMGVQVRNAAKAAGVKVSIAMDEDSDSLVVSVSRPETD